MEILTPKTTRRSTRLRVELPLVVTSLDRKHPFASQCMALVVSPQGCGLRASQALPLETPVLLSDLPAGGSASARVASCLPLGTDGKHFLIGVSLYNPANVWGISDPPADWTSAATESTASGSRSQGAQATGSETTKSQTTGSKAPKTAAAKAGAWPYNRFGQHGETHPRRK